MNIKPFLFGTVTALALTLGGCQSYALKYSDQKVNREAKVDMDRIKPPPGTAEGTFRKDEWILPEGWRLIRASGRDFCYLVHSNYPGLTITETAVTYISETNDLTYDETFAILDANGVMVRYYTRDVSRQTVEAGGLTLDYYTLKLINTNRRLDLSLGWTLKIGPHLFSLAGSREAMAQLENCEVGEKPVDKRLLGEKSVLKKL